MSSARIASENTSIILVDDDINAIKYLEYQINKWKLGEIVGIETNAEDALNKVIEHRPDLLFLAINLPDKNGFDLIKILQPHLKFTTIIVISSFEINAIRAIRHMVFDFLPKPFKEREVIDCFARYYQHKHHLSLKLKVDTLLDRFNHERLKFNSGRGFFFLNANEILYFKAEGAYTEIVDTDGKTRLISSGLGLVEKNLNTEHFFRINRSIIVNRGFISEVNRTKGKCIIRNGDKDFEFHIPIHYVHLLEE